MSLEDQIKELNENIQGLTDALEKAVVAFGGTGKTKKDKPEKEEKESAKEKKKRLAKEAKDAEAEDDDDKITLVSLREKGKKLVAEGGKAKKAFVKMLKKDFGSESLTDLDDDDYEDVDEKIDELIEEHLED